MSALTSTIRANRSGPVRPEHRKGVRTRMSTLTLAPAPAPPARSLDQRMRALLHANEIRTARAQLKRDLKAGRREIVDVLLDPPDYLATAKVYDLLMATPKLGRVKVNRILALCRISMAKTVGGLSTRQRAEIAIRLGAPRSRVVLPAPRPAREETLTVFQQSVLAHACELGGAGPAYVDDIAAVLATSAAVVSTAAGRLHARGLLTEFGDPTPAGRALHEELVA